MSERSNEQVGGKDEPKKHVVVACLEPFCVTEEFERIPPHITVLPPAMMTSSQRSDFIRFYSEVAEENLPFTVHTNDIEYFGNNNDIPVLPVSGVFGTAFAGAVVLAKRLGIEFDDTYMYRSAPDDSMRFMKTVAVDRESGDFKFVESDKDEADWVQCINWNQPHITDFEGVVGPGETFRLFDIQLFCYEALRKRVKAVFRRDIYDFED